MEKRFILGVGAQKAGTTWLYAYLAKDSAFMRGFSKEYHVWDVRNVPTMLPSRRSLPRIVAKGLARRDLNTLSKKVRLWRMERDPNVYFDYFERLLDGGGIAADITPSYCGCDAPTFESIRNEFARRGIMVKCVFLMRDPLTRCHSAVRMIRADGRSREGVDVTRNEIEALRAYYRSEHAVFRTRYDRTLEEIDKVFEPQDRFLGFYEDMFTPRQITCLSDFAGVECRPDLAAQSVRKSQDAEQLPDDLKAEIREFYRPTYVYCAERFPRVRKMWCMPPGSW